MLRADDGYTLLELLVAVALIAMMSVPLALGIQFGIHAWSDIHTEVSEQERTFLVRQRLKGWVEAAYPFDVTRHASPYLYPLSGQQSELILVAPVHPDPRVDALYRTEFRLNNNDFQVGIVPDHGSYVIGDPNEWTTLLSGVEELEFSYLDALDPDNPIWISSWSGRRDLPVAVRVRLSFSEQGREWGELIAPIVLIQWSHCTFQAGPGTCEARGLL